MPFGIREQKHILRLHKLMFLCGSCLIYICASLKRSTICVYHLRLRRGYTTPAWPSSESNECCEFRLFIYSQWSQFNWRLHQGLQQLSQTDWKCPNYVIFLSQTGIGYIYDSHAIYLWMRMSCCLCESYYLSTTCTPTVVKTKFSVQFCCQKITYLNQIYY